MRYLALVMVFISSVSVYAFDHTHKDWSAVLSKYQDSAGMVRYQRLKDDTNKDTQHIFNRYLASIQAVPLGEYNGWTNNQKMAFLINAYNALTVKLILDHYPVVSIKKIGGLFTKPWSVKFFSLLDGKIKSLDPIEHEWLRPNFKDYRIHAAVNCASYSCPPLRKEAFVADKLDAQLDEQMKLWLADSGRNDLSGNPLKISKIFDWYKKDFDTWGGGVLSVLKKYAPAALKGGDIEFLDYDWKLNTAK